MTLWPEVPASLALEASGGLELRLVQDYDQSETTIPAVIINNPTTYSPRIVFQINTSDVPDYGGLYTVYLREYAGDRPKWGTTNIKWADAHWLWSSTAATTYNELDQDRGTVQGVDTAATIEYLSSDELGTYTTYHI